MPIHHGQGLFVGLLPALVSGSSVVCASQLDPGLFFELFTSFQPSWFTAVPSFYQALLSFAKQHQIVMSNPKLRYIRSGSAPMTSQVMREVEAFFGIPVLMGYGSAESCHIANNPLPPQQNKPGTVGIAYGNAIAIVDSSFQRLPNGQIGEVVVRGMQVTLGYLNNASANQELFVDGWLRTGDLGSLDEDGYLTLVGRIKDQINRGGESIVPAEIEEVLLSHPSVVDASVFAFTHPTLGEEIAAAIVCRREELDAAMLSKYLAGHLQASKCPRKFLMLRELPLTRIGKINKLELKRIVEAGLKSQSSDSPAIGDIEKLVASVISEVLELNPPGREANFFLLGVDSLSGTRVIARLSEQLSLELPITLLFEAPTVRTLAERIDCLLDEALAQLEGLS
jgi:acyl-CoA synthetase (AMP-forming)/AMP-acid ligase II/acyl carrier protein